MRRRALIALGKPAGNEPGAQTRDFGLWGDPDRAKEQFDVLQNWKLLPKAGGWEDQDEHFRENITTLLNLYAEEMSTILAQEQAQRRGR